MRASARSSRKVGYRAGGTDLRDLRIAEVVEQDPVIEDGKVEAYRTKPKALFCGQFLRCGLGFFVLPLAAPLLENAVEPQPNCRVNVQ
jgi:Dodecin